MAPSLFEQVKSLISSEMRPDGQLRDGRQTTLKALARWANLRLDRRGVSATTLQRVMKSLAPNGRVELTRRKGVKFGPPATVAARPHFRTIGFIASEIRDPFVSSVVSGVLGACRTYDHRLLIADSQADGDVELEQFRMLMERTDGILMIPVGFDRTRSDALAADIVAYGRPVIFVERNVPRLAKLVERVSTDNVEGGFLAGDCLLKKLNIATNGPAVGRHSDSDSGERRLFVIGRENSTGQIERYSGFLVALSKVYGLAPPALSTLPFGALSFTSAKAQSQIRRAVDPIVAHVREQRSRRSQAAKQGPSSIIRPRQAAPEGAEGGGRSNNEGPFAGVFCLADAIAVWVWRRLADEGIQVPEEVHLIGFDDAFYAKPLGLSTLRQDFEKLGRTAVERLLNLSRPHVVPPTFVGRLSTNDRDDDVSDGAGDGEDTRNGSSPSRPTPALLTRL